MFTAVVVLILSLLLILGSCAVFVNAVEALGERLHLHQGIVGSILAAVGTALPETLIPIIAIFFSAGESSHEVGIGAIAGAPFMLGTLAFFVTGAAVIVYWLLGKRSLKMTVDSNCIKRDLTFFLIFYGVAVSTTFFHEHLVLKCIVAGLLLLSYGIYLRATVMSECMHLENVEELYLTRFFRLPTRVPWIALQLLLSLVFICVGAHYFIVYVQSMASILAISPLILSIVITPIATEFPEKLNSVIWIGKKKDTLALGNITGAMVFQSCFPVVFGMVFTHWDLTGTTMLSAVLALGSGLLTLGWIYFRKSLNPFILLVGGLLYAVFMLYIFKVI